MKAGEIIGIGAAGLLIYLVAENFMSRAVGGTSTPSWSEFDTGIGAGKGSESVPGPADGEGAASPGDNRVAMSLGESPGEAIGAQQVLYADIPGELISWTGPGGWYEQRNISEVLGWSEQEYAEQMAIVRQTPAAERTAVQSYAGGYADNMQEARYIEERYKMIIATGGSMEGGILKPPESWKGSVTAYSGWIRGKLLEQGITDFG